MAQRLADDLDLVNWPDNIKQQQRNWIGGSDGAVIWLQLAPPSRGQVEVFTTRPDTLSGATYVVLAPEHPLADGLVPDAWPYGTPRSWRYPPAASGEEDGPGEAVARYREATARLSDRQRMAEGMARSQEYSPAATCLIPPRASRSPYSWLTTCSWATAAAPRSWALPAHDERDLDFRPPVRAAGQACHRLSREYIKAEPGAGWPGRSSRFRGLDFLAGAQLVTATRHVVTGCGTGCSRGSATRGEPFPIVYDSDNQPVAPSRRTCCRCCCRRWPTSGPEPGIWGEDSWGRGAAAGAGERAGRTSNWTWAAALAPIGAS